MTARRPLLAAIGLALAASTLLLLVRLNRSASLPRGFYLAIPRAWRARPPARGDLVLACAPPAAAELARRRGYLPDGPCDAGAGRGAQALGKVVLAVAGDDVDLEPGGLAVNGRPVAASRPLRQDAAGRPLPHAAFGSRRLAPGGLWLFAPYHPRSYDSRYFGPVPGAAVRGWLLPLAIANDDRFPGFAIHRFHPSVLGKRRGGHRLRRAARRHRLRAGASHHRLRAEAPHHRPFGAERRHRRRGNPPRRRRLARQQLHRLALRLPAAPGPRLAGAPLVSRPLAALGPSAAPRDRRRPAARRPPPRRGGAPPTPRPAAAPRRPRAALQPAARHPMGPRLRPHPAARAHPRDRRNP